MRAVVVRAIIVRAVANIAISTPAAIASPPATSWCILISDPVVVVAHKGDYWSHIVLLHGGDGNQDGLLIALRWLVWISCVGGEHLVKEIAEDLDLFVFPLAEEIVSSGHSEDHLNIVLLMINQSKLRLIKHQGETIPIY